MSLQLNSITIAGNLTKDPEFKQIAGDASVCNFSVAVNRSWRDGNGNKVQEATFFDCEAWDKRGDFVAGHFKKGQAIFVEGRLRQEKWEDDHGGKHSRYKLVADAINFVESAKPEAASAAK